MPETKPITADQWLHAFPWLAADDPVSGADVVEQLCAYYAEARKREAS